jgi:hypothetical protein
MPQPRLQRCRLLAAVGALLLTVAGLTALLASAATATRHSARHACATSSSAGGEAAPLQGICDYLNGREGVVQLALFDEKTGITYHLSNGDSTQYTASIVKVDILARWLHHLQKRKVAIPGGIHYSIRYLMQRMIENSDNAAATALFHFGGGCRALTRFNRLIPLDDTDVGCESDSYYGWGNTKTTAADQVKLLKVIAYGTPRRVLGDDARDFAHQLMTSVEPDQRFGVSCGPWGTSCAPPNYAQPVPGVDVALKNGWKTLPTCTDPIPQCPWQVNSTGWVQGKGRDYVLTVLTTRDPVLGGGLDGFNYGIDTIQNVSKLIWNNLG